MTAQGNGCPIPSATWGDAKRTGIGPFGDHLADAILARTFECRRAGHASSFTGRIAADAVDAVLTEAFRVAGTRFAELLTEVENLDAGERLLSVGTTQDDDACGQDDHRVVRARNVQFRAKRR